MVPSKLENDQILQPTVVAEVVAVDRVAGKVVVINVYEGPSIIVDKKTLDVAELPARFELNTANLILDAHVDVKDADVTDPFEKPIRAAWAKRPPLDPEMIRVKFVSVVVSEAEPARYV